MRLAGILLLVGIGAAHAHDYYAADCCSDRDCHVIDRARVRVTPQGYLLDGEHLFIFGDSAIRLAPEDAYSTCEPIQGVRPKCLYVPPGTS